jgi:uncharacterized protein (TIGR04222 family)
VIRGTRQKLKEVAEVLILLTSTYELAYLAGGRDRFILSCLCDLIQGGYLTHTEGGKYKLAHNFREARHNPATKYLHGLDADEHYNLVQLEPYFVQAYLAVLPRFSKLVAQFEKPLLSRVLSGVAIFTGLLRIMQGSSNGKPVGYLFEMLFIVILVAVIMHRNNGFHAAFRSILDREVLAANRVVSNGELDVVFAGMNGLAGIIAADQLLYVCSIMDRKPESGLFISSGGDGGGGSCGGGGGCGGGCGGCGGS